MNAKGITPILNVSNIADSFAWFDKLGWKKAWDWGDPPSFGAVRSGPSEIFLCLDGQGGRGGGEGLRTWGRGEVENRGVWMSVWVDDVDAVYRDCIESGIEVTEPPADHEWNVREMHVRHPDGHVFRVSRGIEESE